MSYLSFPHIQETPFEYQAQPRKNLFYEVSLKTSPSSDWLKELQGAHRLVQSLLQGELMGQYELLDFLIWPEGVFTRVSLKELSSLSEFLRFLKEKSAPAGESPSAFWDDELQWIRLIPADKLDESTRDFLQTVNRVREEVDRSRGFSPNLLFFYRKLNHAGK
jgi:hypothetical protein